MRSCTLFFAILLSARVVVAQTPDAAKADALFREGRAAMKAGDLPTACPKLEESYRLDPAAGTAVNLGDCFDQQGKIASALLAYRAARKLLKPGDKRIAPVDAQVADLDTRVPKLTITLAPDAPEGVTVTRDGKPVDFADFGRPLPVNPGEVSVVVAAPGHEKVRSEVTLREGQARTFLAEVGEPSGDKLRPSPPAAEGELRRGERHVQPSADARSSTTIGLVLGAVGVAGVGTGMATALMAGEKAKTAERNCSASTGSDQKVCNQADYRAVESGRKLNTVSYVAWGIGLVGIASGGYFLLFADSSDSKSTSMVSASGGSHGGGITIRGRFE